MTNAVIYYNDSVIHINWSSSSLFERCGPIQRGWDMRRDDNGKWSCACLWENNHNVTNIRWTSIDQELNDLFERSYIEHVVEEILLKS